MAIKTPDQREALERAYGEAAPEVEPRRFGREFHLELTPEQRRRLERQHAAARARAEN
jgi:hypothetical protein